MTMQKIKIIELFSGIGAQVAALKRLGLDYEVVGISEIDKYAIQSYEAINGPTYNYGDITKIPMLDYADLWTYSFPCQDLSVAGKQAGINEGTRSGLLLHVERLLENAIIYGNQPKYLLLENVKALVGKKFKPDFERWLGKLDLLGYNNYWQVLNAKDYGVPQNRERVFVVSIRKDVDVLGYKFPEKIPLTRKLKDVLEPVVDEKYYLSQDKVDKLVMNMGKEISNTIRCGGCGSTDGKHTWDIVAQPVNTDSDNYARTICSNYYKQTPDNVIGVGYGCTGVIEPLACASRGRNPDNPSDRTAGAPTKQRLEINGTGYSNTLTTVEKDNYVIYIGNINGRDSHGGFAGDIFSVDGLSPTLNTMSGGNRQPYINEPQVLTPKRNEYGKAVRKAYESGNFKESRHNMTNMQPRVDGVSNTLTTVEKDNYLLEPSGLYINDTEAFHRKPLNGLSRCLKAEKHDATVVQLGNIINSGNWDNPQGGQREPKIVEELQVINPLKGKTEYGWHFEQQVYDENGITRTIKSGEGSGNIPKVINSYRIRKLTPLECWRLMDFTDDEFYAAQLSGVFNSQLYKQAGNSIVVAVLQAIFKELLA